MKEKKTSTRKLEPKKRPAAHVPPRTVRATATTVAAEGGEEVTAEFKAGKDLEA
jgi:hypothetical protein